MHTNSRQWQLVKILTFSKVRKRCSSFPSEGPRYRVTEASAGSYLTQQPSSPVTCGLLVHDSLLPPSQINPGCDSSIHSTTAEQRQKDEQSGDSHQTGRSISQSSSRQGMDHLSVSTHVAQKWASDGVAGALPSCASALAQQGFGFFARQRLPQAHPILHLSNAQFSPISAFNCCPTLPVKALGKFQQAKCRGGCWAQRRCAMGSYEQPLYRKRWRQSSNTHKTSENTKSTYAETYRE